MTKAVPQKKKGLADMHNMADSESEKSVVDDAHLEAASQMLDTAEATSMLQQVRRAPS